MTLARRGEQVDGTLHLTPHHLIFSHLPPLSSEGQAKGVTARPRELWITYPIIAFCTLRQAPAASRQLSSIRIRCRDFTFVCFYFTNEHKAREVFDSIKQWTCKSGRLDKLYAFAYQPPPPEKEFNGWDLYDAMKEYTRQGALKEDSGWRISSVNEDYSVCAFLCSLDVYTNIVLVLPDLSCTHPGTHCYLRQHHQLRRPIPLQSKNPYPLILSSREQMYHHKELSAAGGCAPETQHSGRKAIGCHILSFSFRTASS